MTESLTEQCRSLGVRAKAASRRLAAVSTAQKNAWLHAAADALCVQRDIILSANERDLARAAEFDLTTAQIDRLRLTSARLDAVAEGVRQVAALPDPVGVVLEGSTRPNGLQIRKVSVPIGVILFLYESRPNVTADAAALAIKSGNAIILRGGKEAQHSNIALHAALTAPLSEAGLPADAVQLVATTDREAVGQLLKNRECIDLAIPRGGESLIERVAREATMPVLKHYRGNCHVYLDESADPAMAEAIIVNSKCHRPGVCNAAESLLVHAQVAGTLLPKIAAALLAQGVELRGCPRTRALIREAQPATDDDYAAEFLELILSVRIVDSLSDAVDHIHRFGSGHTEAIVTASLDAADEFCQRVDAAAVVVNASTRFHDGFEFGLGAEIGISTDKFHARGPCGLKELTTHKYLVQGRGQVKA